MRSERVKPTTSASSEIARAQAAVSLKTMRVSSSTWPQRVSRPSVMATPRLAGL